jgi:microcystin degradation protein MlrC
MIRRPSIGIACFQHESNTFLPVRTTYEELSQAGLTRGNDLLRRWTGTHHELAGFIGQSREENLEIVPLLATFPQGGGTITSSAFEQIAQELLEELKRALPLDGLLLALHGAAVSEQFPDADGEILSRVRALLGPDVPIVNTLDLHANISSEMIRHANATIAFRSNPHLDREDRGKEAACLLARVLRGEILPVQALETPPMLIQMCRQYTSEDPTRKMYQELEEVLRWPGILSASIAMGFYFADVKEMGTSIIAVADNNLALAREAASVLAHRAWDQRYELIGKLPSTEEAVRAAAEAEQKPVVLMDTGDNVGGGAPGDSTILFAEVLRQRVENALVILYDPESVQACVAAGPGNQVTVMAGGKAAGHQGAPVLVQGRVRVLSDGCFTETQARHSLGEINQGITAVVETKEQHTVVLTSRRTPPLSLEQILSLGIHPERKRILIVKGVVVPRAAYEPIASRIIVTDTPGVTTDDPRQFQYLWRRVPLFPLEPGAQFSAPVLRTTRTC